MTPVRNNSRSGLSWLAGAGLFLALVIGGTLAARYRLIEPTAFAAACERHAGPWAGCLLRKVLVLLFVKNIAGMASTVLGVWCTITRSRGLAVAALSFGAISMVLYRFDSAVIGVLLGLLLLAREAAGGYQHGGGQHQRQGA